MPNLNRPPAHHGPGDRLDALHHLPHRLGSAPTFIDRPIRTGLRTPQFRGPLTVCSRAVPRGPANPGIRDWSSTPAARALYQALLDSGHFVHRDDVMLWAGPVFRHARNPMRSRSAARHCLLSGDGEAALVPAVDKATTTRSTAGPAFEIVIDDSLAAKEP